MKTIDLCVPCRLQLGLGYELTLVAGGTNNKVTCGQCGKRRYGATYELKTRKKPEDH